MRLEARKLRMQLLVGLLVLSLGLLQLTGCEQETEVLRLGSMPTYSGAIYAVGIEKGFFEEAGVDVTLEVFRSARDRDAAASAGQLDGFMTDIMGAVNLYVKGFQFTMTSREYDTFGVVVAPNSNASEGLTVGIAENTIVDFIADTYMSGAEEKVNVLALPDRMGALLGGQLTHGVFPEPFVSILEAKGAQVVVSTDDEAFYPVVMVFSKDYIDEHEESIQAFYEGYSATIDYMASTDYDLYKEVLVTYGLATEETVDLYELPVDQFGLNKVQEKDFDAIVLWMHENGILEAEVDFEAMRDHGFIK